MRATSLNTWHEILSHFLNPKGVVILEHPAWGIMEFRAGSHMEHKLSATM